MRLPGRMLASRRRVAVWFREARTIRYVEVESRLELSVVSVQFCIRNSTETSKSRCGMPKELVRLRNVVNPMEIGALTRWSCQLSLQIQASSAWHLAGNC
jgi:hypothetical protein